MAQRGRSARTRDQRLARRRRTSQGFDTGGGRRSIFRSKYAKIFYVVGLVGMVGSLVPILLLGGGSPHGGAGSSGLAAGSGVTPVRRLPTDSSETGAVADKAQYAAPPAFTLDTSMDYEALIELEDGSVVRIELFDNAAPVHVNNFVFLANEGFYDGLTFHRVVSGFVAQAGDPTATSNGGAGYVLPDEEAAAAELSLDEAGIISMARSGLGASSSQFFITMTPQGRLDSLGFTAFGRVTDGIELVLTLPERDPSQVPAPTAGALIQAIRIVESGGSTTSSAE